MAVIVVLALLTVAVSPALSNWPSCTRLPFWTIDPRPGVTPVCSREATYFRASGFQQHATGLCTLLDPCKTGDDSLTAVDSCQKFRELPFTGSPEVLLVRTTQVSGTDPYAFLKTGARTFNHKEAAQLSGDPTAFKSPAFALPPTSWGKIRFQLLDADGTVRVSLLFANPGTSPIEDGTWFAKANLLEASPWDVKSIKSGTYNYFSIKGFESSSSDTKRRFHINNNHGGCGGDRGYMLIATHASGGCNYDKAQSVVSYLYVNPAPAVFGSNYKTAGEMRIYGVPATTTDQRYVRI